MALRTSIVAQIGAEQVSALDLGSGEFDFVKKLGVSLADGVLTGQANKLFTDKRTLAASATENLDLAGVLVDAFGTVITFAAVKALMITAADANVNDVVIGNAAATAWVGPFGAGTHTVAIRPGGVAMFVAPKTGWAVGAGATDFLKVLNGGAGSAVEYDIVVVGI